MPYTHKWLDMSSVTIRFSISQNILCIHCWLCRVFIAACGLSLVVASRGYSLVVVCRHLIVVASLIVEHGI